MIDRDVRQKPVMCSYGSNFVTIELPPDVIFAEIEISSDNNIIIPAI